MIKNYQIKLFNSSNVYKTTIKSKDIQSQISFSEQINGGQGQLTVSINDVFESTTYTEGDIVRVYEYDNNNVDGILIYSGFVSQIQRTFSPIDQSITLVCIGLLGLLQNVLYYNASYTFSETDDPSEIIKSVIDYVNTKYNVFSYTVSSIESYGTDITLEFDYTTCYTAIQDAIKSTDFRLYVGADGVVYFKSMPSGASHKVKVKNEVSNVLLRNNTESIVNLLHLKRNDGTIKSYTDATSISTYGLKEKNISEDSLGNEATQDEYGDNYILQHKDSIKQTQVSINDKYNIETIKPGDTITVLNINYSIENIQIVNVNYNQNTIQVDLEKFDSFGDSVVGT